MSASNSILDSKAISGCYLFPQPRQVKSPLLVAVEDAELACYRRVVDPAARTLLHFHGNGESVADYVPDFADALAELGLNSLFVEYREYGASTGSAQLVAMLGDGESVLRALDLPAERVIALGRSIGSLYAIELAARQPSLSGLILDSGIADPAERFLAYADLEAAGCSREEVEAEVRRHFNHRRKLGSYPGAVLIMHTENDGLIDISHAERNLRWAGAPQKRLIRFPLGNHNTIMAWNQEAYFQAIADFAQLLERG